MKVNNTISELKYYLYNIGIGAVLFYIYYDNFYRILDGYSRKDSNILFLVLYAVLLLLGIMFNAEKRRNKTSILTNNIVPLEIITSVFYYEEYKVWVWCLSFISLIVSTEYLVYLVKRKINVCDSKIKKKIIVNRIKLYLFYTKNVIGLMFTVILIILIVSTVIIPIFTPLIDGQDAIVPKAETYSDWKIESHYSDLSAFFDEDVWDRYSLRDKTKLLQIVCNIEATFLGLNHELNIKISNKNQLAGSYDAETHTIVIYELHKKTGVEALSTVLHECYHAMQHRIVEVYEQLDYDIQKLYYFHDAFLYKEEFENYVNSQTDENSELFEYYFQRCEIDARNYSDNKLEYYRSQIEEYEK